MDILHRYAISAGRRFEEFYHHTQEKGVNYVRGKVAEIIPKTDGTLMVQYEDTNLGRKGREIFDMVVLCPALIPSTGTKEIADKLGVSLGDDGFIEEKHVKLDPVNTFNQSVFAAGCVLGPKDIHDSVTEGISAAHKVSQFLGKGMILIPPEKPVIIECNGCGECVKACPYNALTIEGGKAVLSPSGLHRLRHLCTSLPHQRHRDTKFHARTVESAAARNLKRSSRCYCVHRPVCICGGRYCRS